MSPENLFFHGTTIRICGSLEIEKALYSSLLYIREYIPVQSIYLQLYEHNLGAMRTIALADRNHYQQVALLTPLPPEIRKKLSRDNLKAFPEVAVISNPQDNLISRTMLEYHKISTDSLLVLSLFVEQHGVERLQPLQELKGEQILSLILEGKALGSIIFAAEPGYQFTSVDIARLRLLREPYTIAMSNAMKHRAVRELNRTLTEENRRLQSEKTEAPLLIGAEFGLQGVMEMVRKVAALDCPVLLLGETGTGKDLIASILHNLSSRHTQPFLAINCGAIPEAVIDSELFGHTRGAFTGAAADKKGKLERADGGTLFLDEIGELSPEAQVRLLRVLQNGEMERVGGEKTLHVDLRIIAATHRDLHQLVREGKFREDLWFRLNVFPIPIPPLRHRSRDIPLLVHHFLKTKARQLKLSGLPDLAPGAIDTLLAYHWPGNVRELENIIERALILSDGKSLYFTDLVQPGRTAPSTMLLDDAIAAHIRKVLHLTGGKVHGPGGAACLLGIHPSTLRHKMDKLGIPYGRNSG